MPSSPSYLNRYAKKMINLNLPRNEIVKNVKKELKLAGITDSLTKHDIDKALKKYKESEPNPEYIQKLRPPPDIDYNAHPLDKAAPEEGNEDEVINEEEVNDPNYYPGMEEEEPIDVTEQPPTEEPDQYPGDELFELPPLRSGTKD